MASKQVEAGDCGALYGYFDPGNCGHPKAGIREVDGYTTMGTLLVCSKCGVSLRRISGHGRVIARRSGGMVQVYRCLDCGAALDSLAEFKQVSCGGA